MKDLHYASVATSAHTVRVSTWQEDGEWHYKFTINGDTKDEGTLGPVDEMATETEAEVATPGSVQRTEAEVATEN